MVLYLDTNHISRLARLPREADCVAVRELLALDGLHLGISWMHLQELSAPTFVSRSEVGALLDELPIVWGVTPDSLFEHEIRAAIHRTLTGEATEVRPFGASFAQTFAAPPAADIPICQMLDALASRSDLRSHLREAAEYGAKVDQRFKGAAAVVRRPAEPILAHIRDLNVQATPSGIVLPRRFTPEEVFARAGGVTGFPSINVAHSLARTRLRDPRYPADANDQIDEWHACYAPYVAAMALDRRTAARFRDAQLPDASKVTHQMHEMPAILANLPTTQ